MRLRYIALFLSFVLLAGFARADQALSLGGDTYVSGFITDMDAPAERDAFLSGFSVDVSAPTRGSLHAFGADVDIGAAVTNDLEAAGLTVAVSQPIGRDLTAAGVAVRIRDGASLGGNARVAGRSVTLEAPVAGSLVAMADQLRINASIGGDVRLMAKSISFGPDAKIAGRLTYSAPAVLDIAASVISADRVTFQPMEWRRARHMLAERGPHIWPSAFTVLLIFMIVLGFLLLVAAMFLEFAPRLSADLQREALISPLQTVGIGILGLALVVGLIPVCIITLVGLPFLPIAVLVVMSLWIGGYVLGTAGLTFRTYTAFRELPTPVAARLLLLAAGFGAVALLNFVPILGWLLNLTIMFLGLGAIVAYAARRLLARRSPPGELNGTAP